jgi:antitoxin ParD1/3/4
MIIVSVGEAAMATRRKTITLSEQQDEWVKARIESGDYTNDSEYFRDLIRRDQEQSDKLRALRQAIQEGLGSGVSDRSMKDIWADVKRKHRAVRG